MNPRNLDLILLFVLTFNDFYFLQYPFDYNSHFHVQISTTPTASYQQQQQPYHQPKRPTTPTASYQQQPYHQPKGPTTPTEPSPDGQGGHSSR